MPRDDRAAIVVFGQRALVERTPSGERLIGQVAAYAGYSLVLLGEGMCSAALNLGPELTPAQIFAEAKIRFDSAVVAATATNDATTLNLATLGRARTLLDLGDAANAEKDAQKIPASFAVKPERK